MVAHWVLQLHETLKALGATQLAEGRSAPQTLAGVHDGAASAFLEHVCSLLAEWALHSMHMAGQ